MTYNDTIASIKTRWRWFLSLVPWFFQNPCFLCYTVTVVKSPVRIWRYRNPISVAFKRYWNFRIFDFYLLRFRNFGIEKRFRKSAAYEGRSVTGKEVCACVFKIQQCLINSLFLSCAMWKPRRFLKFSSYHLPPGWTTGMGASGPAVVGRPSLTTTVYLET